MSEVKPVRRGTLKIECFDADCEAWGTHDCLICCNNATLYWLETEQKQQNESGRELYRSQLAWLEEEEEED